ncbi:MAG: ABC transporter ATP-binding protein [Alphaproteobacteria bacterium]
MLAIKDLIYSIDGKKIIPAINWHVKTGQHAALRGASGSGKTTLLHIIAGLIRPSSGTITMDNTDFLHMAPSALDRWRGKNIGMIFQTLHLVKALNVYDNLRLARFAAGLPDDAALLQTLLTTLGIDDKRHAFSHQLSIGQAQRVAIARALCTRPKWILADEPTSALDDYHCAATLALLESQANENGSTLIVATHDARIYPGFSHIFDLQHELRKAA